MTQIMYVCDLCAEDNQETCGHYDRTDLRVQPDQTTICEDCYSNHPPVELYPDGEPPAWNELPVPSEFRPVA